MNDRLRVFDIRHLTVYRYREPVRLGEHHMMCRPREGHDLRVLRSRLDIDPHPVRLRWRHDVFDNSVAIASFSDEGVVELRFESTVTLEHLEAAPPDYAIEESASVYPFNYSDDDRPDLGLALARRHPAVDLTAWTLRFLAPSGVTPTMKLLQDISGAINGEFGYVRRDEKGVQTPGDTLVRRSGSCRDFALFMMEAVRSLGLAARFVSGYIVPSDDGGPAAGVGVTHAWMQVYLPGAGWVDFDPTNRSIGNRNLIRVAVAWDPAQALPLWGSFIGSIHAPLGMDVRVTVAEVVLTGAVSPSLALPAGSHASVRADMEPSM